MRMFLVSKIKIIIKRICTSDAIFFDEQYLYGHREILNLAAKKEDINFSPGKYLEGGLQHGWTPEAQIWRLRNRKLKKVPRYVWNSRWEANSLLKTKNIAIGAPWLYLLMLCGFNKDFFTIFRERRNSQKRTERILIFPGHSVNNSDRKLEESVHFYQSMSVGKAATVCLYWLDFVNPKVRNAYQDAGFQTYCAGFGNERGYAASLNSGGRILMLPNLLNLFLENDLLISDEIGSGVLYGISTGLDFILIELEQTIKFHKEMGELVSFHNETFPKNYMEWMKIYAPDLLNPNFPIKKLGLMELAWDELGESSLISPYEMTKLTWKETKSIDDSLINLLEDRINDLVNTWKLEPKS